MAEQPNEGDTKSSTSPDSSNMIQPVPEHDSSEHVPTRNIITSDPTVSGEKNLDSIDTQCSSDSKQDKVDDLEKLRAICNSLINDDNNKCKVIDTKPSQSDVSILPILVSDDMSRIKNFDALHILFKEYLHQLSPKTISEVLSVLIATVKKSVFQLESARGLLIPCINHLLSDSMRPTTSSDQRGENVALTRHFLCEWINLLITHSCSVEELKKILQLCESDSSLLNFVQQANLNQRNRPNAYFAFPGSRGSMMSLPPFQKWPLQNGWSFSTWFYLDPKACTQPYLYNFKTGKSGLGYSAHFTGNCLVLTSIRVKGKGIQHCVPFEFPTHQWVHCAITYHNKWRASEMRVYVNGQLPATIELPWQVQTSEIFDKCSIGGCGSMSTSDRAGELSNLSGQMSAIYLFDEGLSPAQICAIHRLGPSYMGQFKYSNESQVNLPAKISKSLYDERLASSLFCLYSPVAVDSGTLCIQLAPLKSSTTIPAQNYFLSSPHAALLGQTKSIITQPISSTIQSVGCSSSLLTLLDKFSQENDADACVALVGFICDLLETSPHWFANEIVQNNGFVIIACSLIKDSRKLLSPRMLDIFLGITRTLLTNSNNVGSCTVLKHFMDNILFNPNMWIYSEPNLQIKLYNYLANEFLIGTARRNTNLSLGNNNSFIAYNPSSSAASAMASQNTALGDTNLSHSGNDDPETVANTATDIIFNEIRRTSTVLQSLHAIKYYYWIKEERGIKQKCKNYDKRPCIDDIIKIRSHLIDFTMKLITKSTSCPLDEVQGILNYLSSCTEEENLTDVMTMLLKLLVEHPFTTVQAMDQKQAIKVIFNMLSLPSESVRVRSIQLMTLFLSQSSLKKKQEIMGPNNLFMLIADKFRAFRPLTKSVYVSLLDLMLENTDFCIDLDEMTKKTESNRELSKQRIENPIMIKVIASLIRDDVSQRSRQCSTANNTGKLGESHDNIRQLFLNDLWSLIVKNRENRRIILQMSVWQHWIVNLIDSTVDDSHLIRDQVLGIFRVLLYQAIRYEPGGWRVWVDTLAIIHTKVSYDQFYHQVDAGNPEEDVDHNKQCYIVGTSYPMNLPKAGMTDDIKTEQSPNSIDPEKVTTENNPQTVEHSDGDKTETNCVSSISDRIAKQISTVKIADDSSEIINQNKPDSELNDVTNEDKPIDSVDLAPTRSYRKTTAATGSSNTESTEDSTADESTLTTIPLDYSSGSSDNETGCPTEPEEHIGESNEVGPEKEPQDAIGLKSQNRTLIKHELPIKLGHPQLQNQGHRLKATASPAFRIPEFKWTGMLVKLLNDVMFSIECDLYNWRCSANSTNLDSAPFVAKSVGQGSVGQQSQKPTAPSGAKQSTTFESLLQRAENQVYITNVVHFVSQLADNIVIAAGGLLPLLADATGRANRTTSSVPSSSMASFAEDTSGLASQLCEGLTTKQANSLLYRLTNIVDIVIFAASHINLTDLEADKETTAGAILRQSLRLACTVSVKNILIVKSFCNKFASLGLEGSFCITENDFQREIFDSYHGCSLLSANALFRNSSISLDNCDLMANSEYSPHQLPNSNSTPSTLPFQSIPIKDADKLMQPIDISRIQACIYHEQSVESQEAQFMALASLYFISVLMVSKYRDIIEPKDRSPRVKDGSNEAQKSTTKESTSSTSTVESNLLSFGRMQPTLSSTPTNGNLTDLLTRRLENTLDTVCPLLKSIMCDFSGFLSRTLIGSHGQDLVTKEVERAFRKANTSPVELVMLLCSQEWQNTLQKNAGLAFIELINEGKVSSIGMKEHIVMVAMEAEFILTRLRADDVNRHEAFNLSSVDSQTSRLHEEMLINSLISSAARRDFGTYGKFLETVKSKSGRNYKLDVWEDDDRRKRRFVVDCWPDSHQKLYSVIHQANISSNSKLDVVAKGDDKTDTKRILELQETIDKSGIDDHCSPAGVNVSHDPSSTRGSDSNDQNDGTSFEVGDEYEVDANHDSLSHTTDQVDGTDLNRKVSRSMEQNRNITQHAQPQMLTSKHASVDDANLEDEDENEDEECEEYYDDHEDLDNLRGEGNVDSRIPKYQGATKGPKQVAFRPGRQSTTRTNSEEAANIDSKQVTNQGHASNHEDFASINEFAGSVVFAAECSLIWSIYSIPGLIQLTNNELYFEPNQNLSEAIERLRRQVHGARACPPSASNSSSHQLEPNSATQGDEAIRKIDLYALRYCDFLICNGKIPLSDIKAIFSRHYLLQPHAIEIFQTQRSSVMFAFHDFETLKRAVKYLPPVGIGIKYGIPQSRRASLMSPRQLFAASTMTQKWQRREIGNFQYLMFLNTIAGRTYQDLNQYPVFPWVLTNYESQELDLNLPSNFRDLAKPVGALNVERRNEFIERYQSWDNPKVPAFHYGTHYSTAAFTLNWLARLRGMPNSAYLALQDGRYEEPSRLFTSVGDSWVSSLTGGQQNVRELVPEFFYLPEMFHSNMGLPSVELPPWAKSPEQFVRLHRHALESELVSCQLHQWIDLIFGYKQRGPEAINAVNTFYYLTYQGNVNLNMIQDPSLREAIETQIKHFGQTPSQLTTEPHPPRFSALHVSPMMFSPASDEINKVVKFPFKNPIVHIATCLDSFQPTANKQIDFNSSSSANLNTSKSHQPGAKMTAGVETSTILTITGNNQYQIHNWVPGEQPSQPFQLDTQFDSSARRQMIDVDDQCSAISLKLQDHSAQAEFKHEIVWPRTNFVVTLDGKFIIMGSFYDNSFRVFSTANGKLCQVIYGHRAPITCIARGLGNATADFYLATGSQDCSILLWAWNERYSQIEGCGVSAVHNPLPKLTISGHQSAVLSVIISAELGLIVSGSKNLILAHTTTNGENLLHIDVVLPMLFDQAVGIGKRSCPSPSEEIMRPHVKDKRKTLLEASMLGRQVDKTGDGSITNKSITRSEHCASATAINKFEHLRDLCSSDYYVNNLQLSRELAFIVAVALPVPKRKTKQSQNTTNKYSPALLMTFNLKGSLMECSTIGQAASGPRLGDVCVMQTTKDGEHIILNDSPITIKVYRTFDLQPLYAYNTNDIPDSLSEDDSHNRIRSLALVDHKFILVGLDGGKIVVYNADFRNV